MYRRAAVFVDKILRGRPPAELPVEKPRRFTLLLNRNAALAQGVVLPRSFLAQVDEVIES
jgi:putative ABC transport system substrate-binding protein